VRSRVAAAAEAHDLVEEVHDVSSGALPARRAMALCEGLFRDHPGALIRGGGLNKQVEGIQLTIALSVLNSRKFL
jgi:hypothetical protein